MNCGVKNYLKEDHLKRICDDLPSNNYSQFIVVLQMKVKNWEKPETCLQSLIFSVKMLFDKTFSQSPPVSTFNKTSSRLEETISHNFCFFCFLSPEASVT